MRAKIGAMSELALCLNGDSAHTPPSHILENLSSELAHRLVAGAPHAIYAEVWHAAFWQEITLEWLRGVETPCPERAALGFPTEEQVHSESWADLCRRFLSGAEKGAAIANGVGTEKLVVCPSPAGKPARRMTVREQLESLAAHNAYHLGRVVLLRQMLGSWPPPSGGFTW
jgi:DinB family protein